MDKKILTTDEFCDVMYRTFGEDIDRETFEDIFRNEILPDYDRLGE